MRLGQFYWVNNSITFSNFFEKDTFIYSLWEGYLQDDSMQKMMKFIKKKNMKFYPVHTSGHAEIDTLKKVVKKLKPGKIIPIHTFHPDKYGGLFSRKIERVSDGEVFRVCQVNNSVGLS